MSWFNQRSPSALGDGLCYLWPFRQAAHCVESALRDVQKPIGVATYAPADTLPAEMRPFFPSSEALVRRLDAVAAALRDG